MIKLTLIITGAIAAISLSSCQTMKGVGQDVQKLGRGVENSATR